MDRLWNVNFLGDFSGSPQECEAILWGVNYASFGIFRLEQFASMLVVGWEMSTKLESPSLLSPPVEGGVTVAPRRYLVTPRGPLG
jgi:hypothetical protein